jgi:hypothetical protein
MWIFEEWLGQVDPRRPLWLVSGLRKGPKQAKWKPVSNSVNNIQIEQGRMLMD